MNIDSEILEILNPVLIAVLTALSSFVIYGLNQFTKWVKIKIDIALQEQDQIYAERIINVALDAIETAVLETKQTYVDAIKEAREDGKLTPDEMKKAMTQSFIKSKQLMGDAVYKALSEIIPDVASWIQSKIEYYVANNK